MRINAFLVCLLTVLSISSCKKSSTSPEEKNEIIPPDVNINVDVYVGGANDSYLATIWKNGEKIALSSGSATYSVVNAIAVQGGDVYAAGSYQVGSAPSKGIACYWKNGELRSIGDENVHSRATGIALNGNDIYISGVSDNRAVFWKNGIVNQLTTSNSPTSSSASSVFVKDGDVYIAGNISDFSWKACYWKNGVITILSTSISVANSVVVNGADIYVTGYDVENNKPNNAALWKNGVKSFLRSDLPVSSSFGNAIAIQNNDVYIAGNIAPLDQQYSVAVYWKNGVINKPTNPAVFVSASAVAAFGNDVYVVGFGNSSGSATLWKNNTQTKLDKTGSSAKAIAIVKRL